MTAKVTRDVLDALRAETVAAHPHECCGILLGQGDCIRAIQPAANIHPQPQTRFEIDPQMLVDVHRAARAGGPQVLGYYHSHPSGEARPSATDSAMAAGDGMIWAIIAGGAVRFWRDGEEGFAALSYMDSTE